MAGDSLEPGSLVDLEQAQRSPFVCAKNSKRSCAQVQIPESKIISQRASENDRRVLLRELLFLEVELKQSAGESISAASYRSRFPEAASDVDTAFAEASTAAASFASGASVRIPPPVAGSGECSNGVPPSAARRLDRLAHQARRLIRLDR